MLLVCPNCATSYQVEPAALGATGRSVRCVRCRNVWFARDPGPLGAIAEKHRADIAVLTGTPDPALGAAPAEPMVPADPWAIVAVDDAMPSADPGSEAALTPTDALAEPSANETGLRPRPEEDPWSPELPQSLEPIAIDDAPALAPMDAGGALPADAKLPEDIETLAARRYPRHDERGWARFLPSGLPFAILALIVLDAALIAWRADVVRVAPQTAALYAAFGMPVNLRGLTFNDVVTTTETHEGVQVLVVEGVIASAATRAVEFPWLRFSVRNAKGQEVYAWTALPARNVLAPGETLAFRSRLASPPPEVHDVLVRFFNRRDLVAGVPRGEGEERRPTH
jgi:predicted Zn finger-like uncharacterized protein